MRILVLMRGAPGCGKSSWIRNNGLDKYALSADKIRALYGGDALQLDGKLTTTQNRDDKVWGNLFKILEDRMMRGEFTVIDACNSKTKEMKRYRDLARQYRYRIYVLDLTDVPLGTCIAQNKMRANSEFVPESVITNFYSRFATQKVPSGLNVIKPDQFWDAIKWHPMNLDSYKAVNVIGDIHGCFTALQNLLEDMGGINPEEYYIFVGDYLDRGIENDQILKWILEHHKEKNIVFIEGNHEIHLRNWAYKREVYSNEFNNHTLPQLKAAGICENDCKSFVNGLNQCIIADFNGKRLFINHAGLPRLVTEIDGIPDSGAGLMSFIGTYNMIEGTGHYKDVDTIIDTFNDIHNGQNVYQVFGHRNVSRRPIDNGHCYILEGGVERGGHIRGVKFLPDKVLTYEVQNHVMAEQKGENSVHDPTNPVENIVAQMRGRGRNVVKESKMDNISSFNFTPTAFKRDIWDDITVKARGLFVNCDNYTIASRSYNKFFNYEECPETMDYALERYLKYPLTAYRKENGFLGIIGYNSTTDELLITSKSTVHGEFADHFRDYVMTHLKDKLDYMKSYIKDHNVSLIFEVIMPEFDPHLIEYEKDHIVLLDVIKRTVDFDKAPYEEVVNAAGHLGIPCKQLYGTFDNFEQLKSFITNLKSDIDFTYENNPEMKFIEGVVIEDQNGFMFKVKSSYYDLWKKMRGYAASVFKTGNSTNTQRLVLPIENQIFGFLKEIYNNNTKMQIKEYLYTGYNRINIIKVRHMFENGNPVLGDLTSEYVHKCNDSPCDMNNNFRLCCCHCDKRNECADDTKCAIYLHSKEKFESLNGMPAPSGLCKDARPIKKGDAIMGHELVKKRRGCYNSTCKK